MKAYTLKIRGGVEVDSLGKKAGKGALIQEELSGTLGVSQDQYLFQPIGIDVYNQTTTGDKAKCMTSIKTDADHIPCVIQEVINLNKGDVQSKAVLDPNGITPSLYAGECRGGGGECYVLDKLPDRANITQAAGFLPGSGDRTRGIGWEDGKSPTLMANRGIGVCVGMETASTRAKAVSYDARGNGGGDSTNTITGDHENRVTDYTAIVLEPKQNDTVIIEGNGSRPSHRGIGWAVDDKMFTLNTIDRHAVAYQIPDKERTTISLETFHCTTEQNIAQPLKARDYKDPLVVCTTLATRDYKQPQCLCMDRATFNQGDNAKYDFTILENRSPTIVARGPNAVCVRKEK